MVVDGAVDGVRLGKSLTLGCKDGMALMVGYGVNVGRGDVYADGAVLGNWDPVLLGILD
jgi:hypothetical protein